MTSNTDTPPTPTDRPQPYDACDIEQAERLYDMETGQYLYINEYDTETGCVAVTDKHWKVEDGCVIHNALETDRYIPVRTPFGQA